MSVVGMLHIKCGSKLCDYSVFCVDAAQYLHDLAEIAETRSGLSYQYPKRYCPNCAAILKQRGAKTEQERDEAKAARIEGGWAQ
tara:strand:- start:260 stop:511 length:252 start_codon:yes stop_codon:yes gene_type:complete